MLFNSYLFILLLAISFFTNVEVKNKQIDVEYYENKNLFFPDFISYGNVLNF